MYVWTLVDVISLIKKKSKYNLKLQVCSRRLDLELYRLKILYLKCVVRKAAFSADGFHLLPLSFR
jgi:hypothetical protein